MTLESFKMTVQSLPDTGYTTEYMANNNETQTATTAQTMLANQTPLPIPYFVEEDTRFVELYDEAELMGRARWGHV